jgi:hypothetical protein
MANNFQAQECITMIMIDLNSKIYLYMVLQNVYPSPSAVESAIRTSDPYRVSKNSWLVTGFRRLLGWVFSNNVQSANFILPLPHYNTHKALHGEVIALD